MNTQKNNQLNNFVLIIEDNESDVVIAKFFLEKNGYIPIVAHNGFDALELVDAYPYKFIIVDLQMPLMPGIEVIKRIRKIDKLKKTPILTVSARNESKDVKLAIGAGANDYIVKPIDPLIFKNKIEALTKNSEDNWFEYTVPDNSEESNAKIVIEHKIHSLNEVGCVLKTKNPMEIDSVVSLASPTYKNVGIPEILCRVVSTKNIEGVYYNTLLYLGIKEELRQKLRILCRTLWYNKENSK